MLQYLLFQSCYMQESLDTVRLKYRRLENIATRIYQIAIVGLGVITFGSELAGIFHKTYSSFAFYWTYYFVLGFLVIVSFGVGIQLQIAMRQFHNFEYKRHRLRFALNSALVVFWSLQNFM